jgi:RHS repeat-associated core domain
MDQIDYYDGLGRPVQTVLKKASPGQKDIATLQEYDGAGRPANSYIPVSVSTSTGAYVAPSTLKTASNSFYGDSYAFEKPVHELSPLNRVAEQYGPGSPWHSAGKSVKTGWLTNTSSGTQSCALYVVASTTSLQRKGLYANKELFVTQTTDEDGLTSYTFTNKLGQTVLERMMDGAVMNDTYYVYDDFGNLRYVLPPSAADALSTVSTWTDDNEILKNFAHTYKYDKRQRCIQKRLPGSDPVEMRYDRADRLIFSQDGNQLSKTEKEWTFYLYDELDRQVVTGIWVSSSVPDVTGTVVKAPYDAGGTKLGGYIVNLTLPTTVKLVTVNYYDDYRFRRIQTALSDTTKLRCTTQTGYDSAYPNNTSPNAKGLLTGTRTYQLSDPAKYTVSALYYDHRGQIVQTRTFNALGGFDDEYFAYTFTGKVKQRQQVHSAPAKTTQTEVSTYSYDHAERLLSVSHKLNSAAQVTLAQYTYDDVGRVKTKKLATETSTYSYNVRSWLTQITGTKFNQTLTYNAAVNGVTPAKALYGGNVSAMKWKAGDETTERGYKFSYDNQNRLTAATYGEGTNITTNLDRFNENIAYNDKMGNIKTLTRLGKLDSGYGVMDNLTYTYTGNKLTKVTDAATASITYANAFHFMDGANVDNEYMYDKNGNVTKDLNKNITSITYNALNLPSVVAFANENTVTYGYDGAGGKLSVAYKSGSTTTKTEYVGNKVYKNGTLSMILTEEGYATLSGTAPTYYYYLKDHQGNNRVVINQSGTVQQVNHYYAFGGLFGEGIQTSNQPYRYNGKELDRFQNLDLFDYGARHYDAALGRWFTVDPMGENYYSFSPYVYCANNPVRFIDPTGMFYGDPPAFPMTEAYLKGLWSGVSGGVDMIIHPKRTFNNLKAAVSDPTGTVETIGNSFNEAYQAVKSGDGEKIASVTGNILGGLVLAEGAVKVVSGVSKTASVTNTVGELSSTGIKAGTNAAKKGTTVIGEGMARVEAAASKIPGAKILDDMPTFTGKPWEVTSQMMQYNRKWILNEMRSGRTILDIGRDLNRANPSIFYQMEQNMLRNYQKLHPGSLNIVTP